MVKRILKRVYFSAKHLKVTHKNVYIDRLDIDTDILRYIQKYPLKVSTHHAINNTPAQSYFIMKTQNL